MTLSQRPKVVILGMLTKIPVGGVVWLVASYAAGLQRLGFDVYYVEAHGRTPTMFLDSADDDGTGKAVAWLAAQMRRLGLEHRWAFSALHEDGRCYGLSEAELARLYRDAALIVNLHGGTFPRPEHSETGRLIYLGTDPVELEVELDRDDAAAIAFLEPHVAFFTWGLNFGNPGCELPWSSRFPFVPSPPPVLPEQWLPAASGPGTAWTTVGNWRQPWRNVRFRGRLYRWSKHHEFLKLLDLPQRTGLPLELALSSLGDDDRALLAEAGWSVRPALPMSADPDSYRDYVATSRGEFSVAKEQNVALRTGWFSERSAAYLAAGRPVVVQDTGFDGFLPTGAGLLGFSTPEEAADALLAVDADYERHRAAAVDLARTYFDADVVLRAMLDHVGLEHGGASDTARPSSPACDVGLPESLVLEPRSRRPLRLPEETTAALLARPVPSAPRRRGAPVASVLVVTWDHLALTRLALESVLEHTTDVPYEIVVVDNASSDGTAEYLSVLASRNPHVRVIANAENRGFAPACNQALDAARGDVLVLLNNDAVVAPGWLTGLTAHLADPGTGLVGPVTNRCGNEAEVPYDARTLGEFAAAAAARRTERAGSARDVPVAILFCAALRRDTLEAVGGLDERFEVGMFEDDDFSRRVRASGRRVVCAEDVLVHHFGEASFGDLVPTGRYGELFRANRRRLEEKWGEAWEPHRRRPDEGYRIAQAQFRELVEAAAEPGERVLVVSRGDDALVDIPTVRAEHFPSAPGGGWAGHHPADSAEVLALLEEMRNLGARYLAIPAISAWWLRHYDELVDHLESSASRRVGDSSIGLLYDLGGGQEGRSCAHP